MRPEEVAKITEQASAILDEMSAKLRALGHCPPYVCILAIPGGFHHLGNGLTDETSRAYLTRCFLAICDEGAKEAAGAKKKASEN